MSLGRLIRTSALALVPLVLVAACAAPIGGARSLDPETFPPELVEGAGAATAELEVTPLRQKSAIGARIVFGLDGRPEDVLSMLLDFEHADGRRAWSTRHELVADEGEVVTARWHLKGKQGIQPTVELAFVTEREPDRIHVTFDLVERVFAVSELFGDYTIVPDGRDRSLLSGRVFVASGLPFGGPTTEDIVNGMRVDASLMRSWMSERLLAR